jgi:two-component system LytT family sensor kinase
LTYGTVQIGVGRTRRAAWWAIVAIIWTALAVLSITQSAVARAYNGVPIAWGPLIAVRLADWYTCALFIPAFVWLARRFPIERGTWRRSVAAHLAASVVCVIGKYVVFSPLERWLSPRPTGTLPGLLAASAITELMLFWAVMAVIHGVEFYNRYREREATAFQLQARLSEAQLEALRAQLHPHFLFNTLNAIATLMHRDPNAADIMLTRLSDLLRATLHQHPAEQVPLREEIALLSRYLDIMKVRYGDRLTVRYDVPNELEDALVPSFVLQPLVENALEHGVARQPGPGYVEIAVTSEGGSLRLTVTDNGPGVVGSRGTRAGVGLSNTRRRLEQLYGAAQRLVLASLPDRGAQVTIELPLRRSADAAA